MSVNPALSRMIERLRRMAPEDVSTILSRLTVQQRTLARALLAAKGDASDTGTDVAHFTGLSSWLAAKVMHGEGLMPQVHKALTQSLKRMDVPETLDLTKPSHNPSLFEQLRKAVPLGRSVERPSS